MAARERGRHQRAGRKSTAQRCRRLQLKGHDQIVQRLLENGADINATGRHYGTTLQGTSDRGHGQIVKRLLENRADVNAQRGSYGTALQAASAEGPRSDRAAAAQFADAPHIGSFSTRYLKTVLRMFPVQGC